MYGFVDDPAVSTLCRRAQLQCNGIKVCEHFDHNLLENCERYEPDPEGMKELWNHELDANARESNSITNILTRCVFHWHFVYAIVTFMMTLILFAVFIILLCKQNVQLVAMVFRN